MSSNDDWFKIHKHVSFKFIILQAWSYFPIICTLNYVIGPVVWGRLQQHTVVGSEQQMVSELNGSLFCYDLAKRLTLIRLRVGPA
jgi:hypothetical protein